MKYFIAYQRYSFRGGLQPPENSIIGEHPVLWIVKRNDEGIKREQSYIILFYAEIPDDMASAYEAYEDHGIVPE